ncbi:hypothetical protein [uncultured Alistipes sp.]|uniref:hypothetical protein n=1 Tax=uncultured Alistipes sp. TaxID=538949 RepID=UPI003209BF94
MKPTQQAPKEPSAEEQRRRAAAEDPARVKRHLKTLYVLAGIWCGLTAGWGIAVMCKALPFTWTNTIVLFCTFLSIGISIVNSRRILAGKRPW